MNKVNEVFIKKSEKLKELVNDTLPELYCDFANAKSKITKKFLMDIMHELENEKQTLIKDIMVLESSLGITVGTTYNFLFEGENNKYDKEYKDYI
jgi:hypothetical protein